MESTRQKTFTHLRTVLPVVAVLTFILLIYPALSVAGQYKVFCISDGDTIKILNFGTARTIRIVGCDAPETFKKKNVAGQPFSRKSNKHLASVVLNKSAEFKSYGKDRYGRALGVILVDGKNVNLEMIHKNLAEVYRGRTPTGFDNDPYRKAEQKAREAGQGM